jgi:hypothetical protein
MDGYNDFVNVDHPNNKGDNAIIFDYGTKRGSVGYSFKITKYSITNYEYVKFLNSVDPDGINTDNIYYEYMNPGEGGDIIHGSIFFNPLAPKGEKYSIREFWNNKPIGYVTWYECARYCNWLNNNAPIYSNSYQNNDINAPHNYGVYDILNQNLTMAQRSKPLIAAKYRLPTVDELHKSGYYEESESFTGYHKYPTRSEKIVCVSATNSGDGIIPESCDPPAYPVFNSCTLINDLS